MLLIVALAVMGYHLAKRFLQTEIDLHAAQPPLSQSEAQGHVRVTESEVERGGPSGGKGGRNGLKKKAENRGEKRGRFRLEEWAKNRGEK